MHDRPVERVCDTGGERHLRADEDVSHPSWRKCPDDRLAIIA